MKKFLLVVLSFLLLSITSVYALPTLVQVDPGGTGAYSITGVSEFDWSSIGNLVIEDSLVSSTSTATSLDAWLSGGAANIGTTATFNIHGQTQLQNYAFVPGGSNASGLDLFNNANPSGDYEITATLDATETATLTLNASGNLELVFTAITGTFQYYLDVTPDSDPYTGAGFNNGDPVAADPFLWGSLDAVSGNFEIITLGSIGGGSSDIASTIVGYNSDYIETDPESAGRWLIGSEFETTVEYLSSFNPNPPIIGDAPYTVLTDDLVLIADSNSTFTAVPEPASALLLGIGLLGIAAVSRKKIS